MGKTQLRMKGGGDSDHAMTQNDLHERFMEIILMVKNETKVKINVTGIWKEYTDKNQRWVILKLI